MLEYAQVTTTCMVPFVSSKALEEKSSCLSNRLITKQIEYQILSFQ